ncbi:MAG: class I SAM-dependent methyltransferase [Actinomycetota bacterium]
MAYDYDEGRAAAYDRAHAERFAEAPAVASALAALVPGAGRRVLELGVGTGRLALPLAERGFEVTGIDSSEAMVARLLAKPGGDRLGLVIGDFGDVAKLVHGQFDLVFVAFNTLFELADQQAQVACFAGVAERLGPGGVFVVEAVAPDLTRLDQTVTAVAAGADRTVLQATRHDPATQQVTGADVSFAPDGAVSVSPWSIRYASVAELDLMARLAGLRLVERWGGWHRQPFTAASAVHVSVYGRP